MVQIRGKSQLSKHKAGRNSCVPHGRILSYMPGLVLWFVGEGLVLFGHSWPETWCNYGIIVKFAPDYGASPL